MGVTSFFRGGPIGHYYDPHKPWVLQTYKGGGGMPKRVQNFATQAEAAAALRHEATTDSEPPGDRWVYRIRHSTSGWNYRNIFHDPMDHVDYYKIARIQYALHLRSVGYAARTRTRRARTRGAR